VGDWLPGLLKTVEILQGVRAGIAPATPGKTREIAEIQLLHDGKLHDEKVSPVTLRWY
jgi:hypothetical protein